MKGTAFCPPRTKSMPAMVRTLGSDAARALTKERPAACEPVARQIALAAKSPAARSSCMILFYPSAITLAAHEIAIRVPQRLKPNRLRDLAARLEAVPFQNRCIQVFQQPVRAGLFRQSASQVFRDLLRACRECCASPSLPYREWQSGRTRLAEHAPESADRKTFGLRDRRGSLDPGERGWKPLFA